MDNLSAQLRNYTVRYVGLKLHLDPSGRELKNVLLLNPYCRDQIN